MTRSTLPIIVGTDGSPGATAAVDWAAHEAVLRRLPLVVLAQLGVIICVGVLLDTLVVRTVLVPAIGLILGDRFWWPRRVDTRPSVADAADSTDRAEGPVPVGGA